MMQSDLPNSFLKLLSEGEQCTSASPYDAFAIVVLCHVMMACAISRPPPFPVLLPGFDSDEEDRKLRLFAVDSYVSLLQQEPDKLPQRFLQVISWVRLIYVVYVGWKIHPTCRSHR